jgi:peptidoglycan/LPS O-acetylase OafA/YrhL
VCLYFVLKCYFIGFETEFFNSFLNHKSVVYLGSISYGIYLIHLPLGYYLNQYYIIPYWEKIHFEDWGLFGFLKNKLWAIAFPIYTILSILLAGLAYRYIETPFLKLKDKYFSYHNNLNQS